MLHREAGGAALGLFRIVVFGIWAVLLLQIPLVRAADLPLELYSAPGLLSLLPEALWPSLFQPVPLILLHIGLASVVLAAAAGVRPFALIGPAAFAAVLFFDGIMKGWGGYLNHAQVAPLMAALFVAVSPAAGRLSVMGPTSVPADGSGSDGRHRYPFVATAFVLAVAYALIGAHRMAIGGLEIFTGDALPTYLALRTFEYATFQYELSYALLQSGTAMLVLKAGFAVTTLFEILSPVALVSRRFRVAWLSVILPFHVITLFTMNIFFWENMILIGLVFTEIPARFERWWASRSASTVPPPAVAAQP